MATNDQMNEPTWGPAQPHPLSQLQTELVWEGKYDEYGDRRTVDASGLAMPMQRIETIDEPRARVEAQGDLFDTQKAHLDDFRNLLVWGDNKLVMASLAQEFKGSVDLIYIDPSFDVGADFTLDLPIGDSGEEVVKDQSARIRDGFENRPIMSIGCLLAALPLPRESKSASLRPDHAPASLAALFSALASTSAIEQQQFGHGPSSGSENETEHPPLAGAPSANAAANTERSDERLLSPLVQSATRHRPSGWSTG